MGLPGTSPEKQSLWGERTNQKQASFEILRREDTFLRINTTISSFPAAAVHVSFSVGAVISEEVAIFKWTALW